MIPVATAIGSALVGGVYAAFSVMVMPALRVSTDETATAVMQKINRVAERGPFIVVFAATAVAATALSIEALRAGTIALAPVAAAGLSLTSTVITVAANVPLNRRLDREGSTFWPGYRRRWGAANAARAVAAIGAVALLTGTVG